MKIIAISLTLVLVLTFGASAAQCVKIIAVGGYRMPTDGSCDESVTGGNRGQRERNAARKAKDEHDKKCRGIGEAASCDLDNPAFALFRKERDEQVRENRGKDAARREAEKAKADERRAREDARRQADNERRDEERKERRQREKDNHNK